MTIILIVLTLILGASVGSFISVVIHRINKNQKGIFFGRSKCPSCKKQLISLDLIPILSYAILKGKCRYCKQPISRNYLYLEIFTALLFVSIFLKFNFIINNVEGLYSINTSLLIQFILHLVYSIFLIAIFFYDLEFMVIPDLFLFPFIGISLISSLVMGNPNLINLLLAGIIMLIFFGGQILVSKGKWLGEGDLYLALSIGFILGWKLTLIFIVITYLIGAITSIVLLVNKQVKSKSQIAFAPFMVLATLVTFFFGDQILAWYLQTLSL